jgi:hypothetical protein
MHEWPYVLAGHQDHYYPSALSRWVETHYLQRAPRLLSMRALASETSTSPQRYSGLLPLQCYTPIYVKDWFSLRASHDISPEMPEKHLRQWWVQKATCFSLHKHRLIFSSHVLSSSDYVVNAWLHILFHFHERYEKLVDLVGFHHVSLSIMFV